MIDGKTVLAVIAARGGSKGLPNKNILDLNGKPVVAWSIESAQNSKYIDRLVLSSDDSEINKIAKDLGCDVPFVRPANLATDTAPIHDAVAFTVENLEQSYDLIMLLQATSPLRTTQDIDSSLETFTRHNASSCISVSPTSKPPFLTYTLDQENRLQQLIEAPVETVRRQDFPTTYILNGAIYIVRRQWFMEHHKFFDNTTCAYIMPKNRSVDIDDRLDFMLCEAIMKSGDLASRTIPTK